MRKVLKLDVVSVVRLFVIFYAVIGLYAAAKAALTRASSVVCPFGLEYPYLYWRINLTIDLPDPPNATTPFFVVIAAVFYAITGAVSGATAAFAYNLTSRFWPGIAAIVEPGQKIEEPSLAPPVHPSGPPAADLPTLNR